MPRILVDLPENDIAWLDGVAAESGRSRAAVLREAVAGFRATNADWLERGFGLWTAHGGGRDGDEFEVSVRPQWATLGSGDTEGGER
ncbi:MAG TPA: CopG family transcriptional regulator [Croceibacterium sp.]